LTGYGGKWIQSAALALALMLGLMLLPSLPSHAQIVAPDPTDALEASDPADVGEDDPDALLGAADDGLPAAEIGVVAAVYSGNTLRLADGREVVLPHVMPPGADRFRPLEQRRFDRRATMGLADMVLGRTVRIDLAPIARDRRGRLRARLILMEGDAQPPDPADIAVRLVTAGMVRVMPEPGADPARIAVLLAAERTARAGSRGLWRRYFRVHGAEPYDGEVDRFQIIEGTVQRVGRASGRYFLEFGQDWRTDFTGGLTARAARSFTKAGLPPESLAGQRVRLRGWVRPWNGPFMDLTEPVQVEVLGEVN
jgi:endonuclease YncB( thermonuclease family)